MRKCKLEIIDFSFNQTWCGANVLVLREANGKRRIPIIIGTTEAHAILMELEKITPHRPLTHDLFKSFAGSFNIKVKEVIIYNFSEGLFYAKLICSNRDKEKEIEARVSDSLVLATRFGCPIFTYEFILQKAGINSKYDKTTNRVFEVSKGKEEEIKATK